MNHSFFSEVKHIILDVFNYLDDHDCFLLIDDIRFRCFHELEETA